MLLAARAAARGEWNEPFGALPPGEPAARARAMREVSLAFLVERMGPVPGMSVFDMAVTARVLDVYRTYEIAGTSRQRHLSAAQWRTVLELDAEARREAERLRGDG